MTEAELQIQVAEYLDRQYKGVEFFPDFGSGAKLTPRQAVIQKRQRAGRRGQPDLFIAEPAYLERPLFNTGPDELLHPKHYCGLFIELKKEGTRLTKKDGNWATPHIKEQAETLGRLIEKGYYADFACGFDEAKEIIHSYLKGAK